MSNTAWDMTQVGSSSEEAQHMAERQDLRDAAHRQSVWARFLRNRYAWARRFCAGKDVLDVPAGMGWGAAMLQQCARRITVADLDEESARFCRTSLGLDSVCCSMSALPFARNSFDVVSCFEGIEHLKQSEALLFLDEVRRVLRRGGSLVGSTPVLLPGFEHSGNPHHQFEFRCEALRKCLQERFDLTLFEVALGGNRLVAYFCCENSEKIRPSAGRAALSEETNARAERQTPEEEIEGWYYYWSRRLCPWYRERLLWDPEICARLLRSLTFRAKDLRDTKKTRTFGLRWALAKPGDLTAWKAFFHTYGVVRVAKRVVRTVTGVCI